MRSRPALLLSTVLLGGLALVIGGTPALAQWDDEVVVPPPPPAPVTPPSYAPPPPPPPPAPGTVAPAPVAPRPGIRGRRRAAPWGRFYIGAGVGWVKPSQLSGIVLPSSGWGYHVWTGWRKAFFGLELGYLGANLRSTGYAEVMPVAGETDAPTAAGGYYQPVDDRARLGHVTLDAKLYLRLLCRLSIFVRLGINHTRIVQGGWFDQSGWGWQYGTGLDWRIRLGWRPDLVLKLRGEVVKLDAALAPRGGGDRQAYSTVGLLFSLNLGWAPR